MSRIAKFALFEYAGIDMYLAHHHETPALFASMPKCGSLPVL